MTHARLLDIAIVEFGEKGLAGASTRGIAKAAGTAMSSITYHYGGKEGLYLAAADHIAEQMAAMMDDALTIGEEDARTGVHRILGRFTDKLAENAATGWPPFILREQMNPTEAFDRIYDGALGPMLDRLTQLVCAATGLRDIRMSRIATITLMGQVVSMRSSRASCLRLMEVDHFSTTDIAAIKVRVAANTDAILDRLIAEQKGLE